ncbi:MULTISPECIES: SPFH domain-containing protein, partial [unclassified Streptomyces]|uniref:SPFH domain-containing protein n=1 Tax=unclassified Streptomyces TaxID=2593676 RepID=UPI00081F583D
MFVLSILLIIAAVVLAVLARSRSGAGGWKLGAALAGVAGLAFGVISCVYVVSAYEVGVPVLFGKTGTPLKSGMHLKTPFTDVTTFSTRPVDLNLNDKDVVEVRSSQGGVLYADVTVKWAVTPENAVELYRLAGSQDAIQERLVLPDS